MNKDDLNVLLDSIYELEGLVHLALAREDIPDSLPSLIMRKGEELSEHVKKAASQISDDRSEGEDADGENLPIYNDSESEKECFTESGQSVVQESFTEPEPIVQDDVCDYRRDICEPRGRLVFSINDRYRFKRELFSNSDADFNNTLALVASMEGFDEAEDYFIGELQWDPNRQEVADFLEILKKYFKA